MTQTAHDDAKIHMGLPLPHGKLAVWLFLVTEIMFFTALIGTYVLLRNGVPTQVREVEVKDKSGNIKREKVRDNWPKPHTVHLSEPIGAINTFVLICSSLTVVLAHYSLGKRNTKRAVQYVLVTLLLGTTFLVIKAYEYMGKFDHDILPGRMGESLPDVSDTGIKAYNAGAANRVAQNYTYRVREQLDAILKEPGASGLSEDSDLFKECKKLREEMVDGTTKRDGQEVYRRALSPPEVGQRVNDILEKAHEEKKDLHLAPTIPFGNMWASCYFAMTGFHALHVFGGLVIFVIILVLAALGRVGPQHEGMLELTGLYWHFVDIVWIFLFPLIYLV